MQVHQKKVVAFNGSARKGGNTAILLGYVLKELEKEGIETELIELSGSTIQKKLCHVFAPSSVAACIKCDRGTTSTCSTSCTLKGAH